MEPLFAAGFLGIESFNPPWDIIFLPLFNALIGLYEILFHDLALAIIVLTIVIRTLLAPLFIRQIRSQKEMQRMQPLVKEIQRKHKGNQRKISEETAALYKEHGVNMFGGCLPLVLQLPILFALYQTLTRASSVITFQPSENQQASFTAFLAVSPDVVPLGNNMYQVPIDGSCVVPQDFHQFLPLNCQLITPFKLDAPVDTIVEWLTNPFTGVSLNLATVDHAFAIYLPIGAGFAISMLAVLAALLQFIQVRMTSPRGGAGDDPTATTTQTMTYLFPIMTIVWGGIFPSGLVLYWGVYTAYLIIQQYLILGWGNLFPLFGWQPRWAPSPDAGDLAATKPKSPTPPPTNGSGSTPEPARPGGQRRSGRRRRGREGRKR
ncbi:MAG TPA: YidC/Oxa1 family membrane protein insertase [Candidatus Limnocylindria bacterium]|nr:YidC/Oxa1 family membrane protein insertase [Candidatus Limnocylindria bacterium]